MPNLYVKYEGMNPTGSFKDRGMVMAISKAVEEGAKAVICASTGNTSASAAAYGAAAGLEVIVVLPKGKIALGKLIQALAAGARIIAVDGNFDEALRVVREMAEQKHHPVTLVNSVNPYRIDGQTTAAFEVCDDLGRAPDILAIPVGNAGNITAYWAGFKRYRAAGRIDSRPKMYGFQAAGAAPIVLGHPVEKPETIATAIRIGNPASWQQAVAARDESGGLIETVTDDEIVAAYRDLATSQGIFCEPASAASLAGVCKLAAAGRIDRDATVVCVLTGHGLKDPETAERTAGGAGAIIEPRRPRQASCAPWAGRAARGARRHRLLDQPHQIGVGLDGRELGELLLHTFGRAEQDACVGLAEHGGVVEGVASGDDVVIHPFERGHGFALLLPDAQLVVDDVVVLDDQPVTQEGRPIELAEQGSGELLERVGQDDDLHERTQFVQELLRAGQGPQRADDTLNVRQLQSVLVQDGQAPAHELVVIRLIARGAAQFRDARLLGHGNPDLRRQHAFHVQGDDRLLHGRAV